MKSLIPSLRKLTSYFHRHPEQPDDSLELALDFTESEDYRNGEFLNSLEQLTKEDVPLSGAAAKRPKTLSDIIRTCIFYLSAVAFVISCIMLVQNLIARQKGEEIYDQLASEFLMSGIDFSSPFGDAEGENGRLIQDDEIASLSSMTDTIARIEAGEPAIIMEEKNELTEKLQKIRAQLQSLAATNEDTYGWIFVEGTNINYPIVQGEDNEYYLDHAFSGDYLPIGSVYADYRCNTSINKNYNTVFYAHNITSGAMFHDVTKFFEDEYFNNTQIVIYTFDGMFVYEPFAIYESHEENNYFKTGFTSFEDFKAFTDKIKGDATKVKDLEFTNSDRIITLSTCTNGASTQRYALHAKQVEHYIIN
ncbi:MAG: class B sortase [Clostridia bacterium]|nr:class B sortase [Clostridia bacterium]